MTAMTCSCCGRDDLPTIALRSHPDLLVCRECVGWLASQVGVTSTPTLPVTELRPAVAFYERAGFGVRVYDDELDTPGAGFAFVEYDGQSVFDLDVVDIDLRSGEVQGTIWFALFSPRVESYTIGIEPSPGVFVVNS